MGADTDINIQLPDMPQSLVTFLELEEDRMMTPLPKTELVQSEPGRVYGAQVPAVSERSLLVARPGLARGETCCP